MVGKIAGKSNFRSRKAIKKRKISCDLGLVKMLGMKSATMVEASQSMPKLADLIAHHKEVAAAWQRGRFLHNVRALASVAVSVSEAGTQLELGDPDDLHRMILDDPEVRDIWMQTRREAFIRIKVALSKTAFEGNQAAIKVVGALLKMELPPKIPDTRKLKVADIVTLTGRTRSTVYEWVSKGHLQIGDDKTVDLAAFIRWFETYIADTVIQKYTSKKTDQSSRLHAMKAEQIEIELKRQRHDLLPREEFIASILARHQVLVNSLRQKAPQIAQLCQGQRPERVVEIIIDSLRDICRELCQVPTELSLPEPLVKTFKGLLESLNNDFTKNGG